MGPIAEHAPPKAEDQPRTKLVPDWKATFESTNGGAAAPDVASNGRARGVGVRRGGRACRSCGGRDLDLLLSLGRTPLANALPPTQDETQPRYPLELAFCVSCTLVQITEIVPPEDLFRHYLCFSSVSDTVNENARSLANRMIRERRLDASSTVVEIASNDGYLLRHYVKAGIPVLGIDPAVNVAAVAERAGVPTLADFFTDALAARLATGLRAAVIHANSVLAHAPDPNGFVRGIEMLLAPGGVAVIEVPYARDLIDRCAFDSIYHEHICYFTATSLVRLFERHRLVLLDIERIPIHGGSLRLFVGRASDGEQASDRVGALLREETINGLDRGDYYRGFASRVSHLRRRLPGLLARLRAEGATIAGYGAAAKGATLLNSCGIGRELIDYVVDISPHKQGRYMPGSNLPIHAPKRLLEDLPDYVLLLSWTYADEILRQQAEYLRRGGRFILPVPEPRIISGSGAGIDA